MFPYWVLFSVFAVGTVQYRVEWQRIRGGPLFILACVFAAAMIGFRYHVGGDWGTYEDALVEIGGSELSEGLFRQDPGYSLINWIIAQMGLGIWAVNSVCSAVFMWGLVRFARRQPNPWLTILIAVPYLVIVVAMGYTRQAVAIGLILAALSSLEDASVIRLLIYAALAASFHKSAVVVLPLIALAMTRGRFFTSFALLLSVPLLYYAFLNASVDKLMTNYIEAQYQSQGASIRVAMNLPPALVFLFFRRRFGLTEAEKRLWTNFSFAALGALVMLIMMPSSAAIDRLALYIIPLQLFVLGRLPWVFPMNGAMNKVIVLSIILYSGMIEVIWLNFADNAFSWLPYQVYSFTTLSN